jgi:hypothetical protein
MMIEEKPGPDMGLRRVVRANLLAVLFEVLVWSSPCRSRVRFPPNREKIPMLVGNSFRVHCLT